MKGPLGILRLPLPACPKEIYEILCNFFKILNFADKTYWSQSNKDLV